MICRKYLVALIALSLFIVVPTLAAAEYSDVVTDDTGDVMRFVSEEDWTLVENPQLDIVKVEVFETEDWVHVELTVVGTITDSPSIEYEIILKCSGGGSYEILYSDGECEVRAERYYDGGAWGNVFEPPTHGAGTDTLTIVFTRENIGEPEDLLISEVYALDESKMEIDMAGPDADYPEGYGEGQFKPVNPILNVDYDPEDFPMDVTVQIGIQNDGDLAGDVSLYIDGTVVYTLSVPANGENTYENTFTFDEAGSYDIEFHGELHTVFVSEPDDDNGEDDNGEDDNGEDDNGEDDNGEDDNGEDDNGDDDNGDDDNGEDDNGEDDAPGFALILLLISMATALMIYHKKKA